MADALGCVVVAFADAGGFISVIDVPLLLLLLPLLLAADEVLAPLPFEWCLFFTISRRKRSFSCLISVS